MGGGGEEEGERVIRVTWREEVVTGGSTGVMEGWEVGTPNVWDPEHEREREVFEEATGL